MIDKTQTKRTNNVAILLLGLLLAAAVLAPIKANALEIDECQPQIPLQESLDAQGAGSGYAINPIANQADVLNVYWTFTGLLNGKSVHDKVVYREYKSISFKKSYSQLSPVNTGVRATGASGEYFSQVRATGIGTVETWRCRYSIR